MYEVDLSMAKMETCVVCDKCDVAVNDKSSVVTLTDRGIKGVNEASADHGSSFRITKEVSVHMDCRKVYTKPQNVAASPSLLNLIAVSHLLDDQKKHLILNHSAYSVVDQQSMTVNLGRRRVKCIL